MANVVPAPASYNDRQRRGFLDGWNGWTDELRQLIDRANGWTDEIRQSIDRAIETRRTKEKDDETQCCLDCGTPLVPCDCREGCAGGKCAVC